MGSSAHQQLSMQPWTWQKGGAILDFLCRKEGWSSWLFLLLGSGTFLVEVVSSCPCPRRQLMLQLHRCPLQFLPLAHPKNLGAPGVGDGLAVLEEMGPRTCAWVDELRYSPCPASGSQAQLSLDFTPFLSH